MRQQPGPGPGAAALHRARRGIEDRGGVRHREAEHVDHHQRGPLLRRQQSAERALLHMGITFNVYGDSAGTERIFPFDLVPRIVFEQLSPQLGQPIVVENRTGAGGTIGAAFVAKSPADGYTLLIHSNAHTIAPALYPTLSYHPARDFAAVPLGTARPGR